MTDKEAKLRDALQQAQYRLEDIAKALEIATVGEIVTVQRWAQEASRRAKDALKSCSIR